jgi:hypothetical protein
MRGLCAIALVGIAAACADSALRTPSEDTGADGGTGAGAGSEKVVCTDTSLAQLQAAVEKRAITASPDSDLYDAAEDTDGLASDLWEEGVARGPWVRVISVRTTAARRRAYVLAAGEDGLPAEGLLSADFRVSERRVGTESTGPAPGDPPAGSADYSAASGFSPAAATAAKAFVGTAAPAASIAVLLDYSGSLSDCDLRALESAVADLFRALTPGTYEAALVKFSDTVAIAQPFTTTPQQLIAGLSVDHPRGTTALWQAVFDGARLLSSREPALRFAFVFTDGENTHASLAVEDAVAEARRVGAAVLSVGLGAADVLELESAARATGGLHAYAASTSRMAAAFASARSAIERAYVLEWDSPSGDTSGAVEVRIAAPSLSAAALWTPPE